jgi:Flp pilus assembly protein TadG
MTSREPERGSAPAEFVLVGGLLVLLVLSVLQLGLALHVRNTVADAASEGARHAALGGGTLESGADRTRELIATALGSAYAVEVGVRESSAAGIPVAEVAVTAPLPVLGLVGIHGAVEVTGRAPLEDTGP